MERDFAAYLFTLFCPLFTSGASFSIAHEYSVRNLNGDEGTYNDPSPNESLKYAITASSQPVGLNETVGAAAATCPR